MEKVSRNLQLNGNITCIFCADWVVVAFGDGENDVPMFEWAGMSVAMPHGWPLALARAKLIAPAGPPETALARGVDLILQ